jgi:hypothetical protein
VNTLKKDWKADLGIGHVLQVGGALRARAPLPRWPRRHKCCARSPLRVTPICLSPSHHPRRAQVVRCLIINPHPESALNDDAGKLFMEDYEEYCKKAKMMTEVHARASKAEPASGSDGADGEPVEKRQKPVDSKVRRRRPSPRHARAPGALPVQLAHPPTEASPPTVADCGEAAHAEEEVAEAAIASSCVHGARTATRLDGEAR